MAEKRATLRQRIGIGVVLGVIGLGVGIGVYEDYDVKKEPTKVVREADQTDKQDNDKTDSDKAGIDKKTTVNEVGNSTRVSAVHKDKNGRVLIRVSGKDKDDAERLLADEIKKSKERDRETDALYKKEVKNAIKTSGRGDNTNLTEDESYKLLEEDVSRLFSYRFGTPKSDMSHMLDDYYEAQDGLTFEKEVGDYELLMTLTIDKNDRLEGYSMRISGDDVDTLRSSSARFKTLLGLMEHGKREYVSVGDRRLEEKKAYTLIKTGK